MSDYDRKIRDHEIGSVEMPETNRQTTARHFFVAVIVVLIVVGLAVAAAAIVKAYVITTYDVEGDSMLPTLVGMHVDADNIPVTDGDQVILNRKATSYDRGDIVVFVANVTRTGVEEKYIKRIIGIEGDRVQIISNEVYLNGVKLQEDYIKEAMITADIDVTVGENQIFVLGDNRNNSRDSRAIGCVKIDAIVGKVFMVKHPNGKLEWMK